MRIPFVLVCLSFISIASCGSVNITDKPIDFDEQREKLTLDYLQTRYDLEQSEPSIDPKMIVVHWTAIPTLEESFTAFKEPLLPNTRSDITTAGALNVSAHFLVDRDGTIYRLMSETTMARHVIGLNHCAIGIENVGGTQNTPLTGKQLRANVNLICYLKKKYPNIDYLIGHFEYTLFEEHPLWLEIDEGYRTEKTDPGADFMDNIRSKTSQANWKPLPEKIK